MGGVVFQTRRKVSVSSRQSSAPIYFNVCRLRID